jgi:predicted amidophosphoribosyltransferase
MHPILTACQDLLLPRTCVVCGRGQDELCNECWERCASIDVCRFVLGAGDSIRPPMAVSSARPFGALERAVILGFKESGYRGLAVTIAGWLAAAVRSAADLDEPVLLVPVPGSMRARIDRGFDSWLAVCTLVCAQLGPNAQMGPFLRHRLRLRPAQRQKRLNRSERKTNMSHRYVVPRRVVGSTTFSATPAVILVDDVVTTGATLAEGVRALRAAGIRCEGAATACAVDRGAAQLSSPDRGQGTSRSRVPVLGQMPDPRRAVWPRSR